jgi:hypothetical protein
VSGRLHGIVAVSGPVDSVDVGDVDLDVDRGGQL